MYLSTLAQIAHKIKNGGWHGKLIELKTGNEISYPDLGQKISEFKKFGWLLSHGDKIIVKAANSVNTICAMLVIWERGGVVVPIKNNLNPASIDNIAADCNAKYILNPEANTISAAQSYKEENYPINLQNNPIVSGVDLALIIYTSGSTGRPKGIMLSHHNVIFSLYSIISYLELQTKDTILNLLPLSFDYGLYQVLFSFAANLKTVLYNAPLQPYQVIKALNELKITVLPVVPSLYRSTVFWTH